MSPAELWNHLASTARVELNDAQRERLWRYIDLLLEANQRMNLTRITVRDEAARLHVADALTLLPYLPAEAHRLADVGSGGGVPGIPLAIVRPDAQVTLIESTRKKATFLRETVQALELDNVSVVALRVEDAARSDSRESHDVAVVRAVATLDWLAEWCLPLVKVGGLMLAMKGPKVQEELPGARRAIRLCGGGEPLVHPIDLPQLSGHVIVQISKTARTDSRFPRPPTHAKGKPLV